MIGELLMATKGSSADPSHTPPKLKGRGGKSMIRPVWQMA